MTQTLIYMAAVCWW